MKKISEELRLHRLNVKKWHDIDGENTFRISYKLDENSIVFDLGGYVGEWSKKIFSSYGSNIFIFEPVLRFVKIMRKEFSNNKKIKIFRFGLSNRDDDVYINIDETASSIFKGGNNKEKIRLVNIEKFLNENSIGRIDLMKINIEGGEYDLLDFMLDKELVYMVKNIQIQFHQFVPNSKSRMKEIHDRLRETHDLTYQHIFINENWKLKG